MLSRLGLGLGLVQGSIKRSSAAASSSVVLSRVLYSSSSVVAPLNEPNHEVFVKYGNPTPEEHSFAPALGYVPDVKVTTLENGLRVATSATAHAETCAVGVWIDAGSRFEQAEDNGSAHFLEHMAFKGTAKRTARSLEQEIENMGGHLNAYTSREQTTYWARVMKKDTGKALDVIADILQNPKLDVGAIEREKSVILREMEEVEKMPEEVLFDHLHATAFQNTSLGRTILGPASNIQGMTQDHLSDYIKTHYTAPRFVVSATGAVDHDEIVDLSKKLFGDLPTGNGKTSLPYVEESPGIFTGSEVRFRDPDKKKLHFAVAVEGLPWSDADSITLMLMQIILGGWSSTQGPDVASGSVHGSSRLASRVAENELADSVSAFNTHYADTGLFGITAVCDPAKVQDLAWSIMYEFSGLCYEVEPSDLERAKTALKSGQLMGVDSVCPLAEDIGRQLITYGRYMSKAELFARIDSVTTESVKEVANRVIYDQDVAIAAVGDTTILPDYNWFRRRTYWLRY
jgi:processing peptidase subunit beta